MNTVLEIATFLAVWIAGFSLGLLTRRPAQRQSAALPLAHAAESADVFDGATCSGCGAVLVDVEQSEGCGWCPAGCGYSLVRP